MHTLGDAVSLGVVRGGVAGIDGVSLAKLLEVLASELASVVHHNVAGSAIISYVLSHVFYDHVCVFCFKWEEPNKSAVMIYYSENIYITLNSSNHVCEINTNPFQGSSNRR